MVVLYSYRDGLEYLQKKNKKLYDEILSIIREINFDQFNGDKKKINKNLKEKLLARGWLEGKSIEALKHSTHLLPKFRKGRYALNITFSHYTTVGTEYLKFEILSDNHLGYIDMGIIVTVTKKLYHAMQKKYKKNWSGTMTFEKMISSLNVLSDIIHIPLLIIGIDCDEKKN